MLDLNTVKERFLALNHDRLSRTRDVLRTRQQDVLDMLPLLFHANHASFPGYISKNTPVGISDYSPSARALEAAKKVVRSFDYKRKALPRYDIHALFLMGSSGTIAYSKKSDFDIWLCHDPELTTVQLAELQQKASAVEEWAATFDLEVHFFLMNADNFRKGTGVELSSESSGSAQHHLLLEEFYRTSILLAGRYPVWWLVPAEEERNYADYIVRRLYSGFVSEHETIDFGGLPEAPAEEFFGAAVWQLYKSIESPYKAALKLMLTEVYAAEYPEVDMLSLRFKRAVQAGLADLTELDPYIMLYRKIEEYLLADEDHARLALMQRCFYFKVNEALGTADNPRRRSWRRDVMRALTQDWGWDEGYLQLLDSRSTWKIHQVLEERRSLVSALTHSYHQLSDFARHNSSLAKINQRDLNILGRKLYAAFERKAGKVDIVNCGISDDVWESHLSLHQAGSGENRGWVLYRGVVPAEEVDDHEPLKRSLDIVELLAWCHLNQVANDRTAIVLYNHDSYLNLNTVKAILRSMNQLFPGGQLAPTELEDLGQAPRLTKISILINVGTELSNTHIREGRLLTSNKNDALSYGGTRENQVLSLDKVVQTSWQEVMTFRYDGVESVLDCLVAYLQWSPPSQGHSPAPVTAHCFSTGRNMTISRRIEELFNDIVACYYHRDNSEYTRYVLMIGHSYYVLTLRKDRLQYQRADSYQDLLVHLSAVQPDFSPVMIDRYALNHDVLPVMYRNNRAGCIQFYYVRDNGHVEVYIIDERGSLFYRRQPDIDIELVVNQYKRFLDAVTYRHNLHADPEDRGAAGLHTVEYYQVIRKHGQNSQLVQYEIGDGAHPVNYFNLQFIGQVTDGGQTHFTVYCEDIDFSTIEHGEQLFQEVARHVLQRRKSGLQYPIYITDINVSHKLLGMESSEQLQTAHLLNYKKAIEEKLNRALQLLVDSRISDAS